MYPPRVNEQRQHGGMYAQEKLNKIRIYKSRAHYDYDIVHSITDSTLVSHVSFIIQDEDGQDTPVALPLTVALGHYDPSRRYTDSSDEDLENEHREALQNGPVEVYLHGNAASMLFKAIKASEHGSVRVCITSTQVDGVVLFLTPNGHSLNYRSAIIHGDASLVPEAEVDKKLWAMRLLTNHMSRGRWEATYPVAESAMKHVQVIEVTVRSASAKIRQSNVGSFDPETVFGQTPQWKSEDVWSGVVPVYEVLGEGISSGIMGQQGESGNALRQVEAWRVGRNARSREYAEEVAAVGPTEIEMKIKVENCISRWR